MLTETAPDELAAGATLFCAAEPVRPDRLDNAWAELCCTAARLTAGAGAAAVVVVARVLDSPLSASTEATTATAAIRPSIPRRTRDRPGFGGARYSVSVVGGSTRSIP